MNYKMEEYPKDTKFLVEQCEKIVEEVENLLSLNNPNKLYLSDFYQQTNAGNKAFRNDLRANFNLNSKNKKYNGKDIKGLYILASEINNNTQPFYVGISQTVIRRLRQHVFGTGHNQATLAYLMARAEYNTNNIEIYKGKRQDFDYFKDNRDRFQMELRKARFAVIEIDNDYLLYMAEVFIACHFKCKWNTFETH